MLSHLNQHLSNQYKIRDLSAQNGHLSCVVECDCHFIPTVLAACVELFEMIARRWGGLAGATVQAPLLQQSGQHHMAISERSSCGGGAASTARWLPSTAQPQLAAHSRLYCHRHASRAAWRPAERWGAARTLHDQSNRWHRSGRWLRHRRHFCGSLPPRPHASSRRHPRRWARRLKLRRPGWRRGVGLPRRRAGWTARPA